VSQFNQIPIFEGYMGYDGRIVYTPDFQPGSNPYGEQHAPIITRINTGGYNDEAAAADLNRMPIVTPEPRCVVGCSPIPLQPVPQQPFQTQPEVPEPAYGLFMAVALAAMLIRIRRVSR
jgi:hypothetical protein